MHVVAGRFRIDDEIERLLEIIGQCRRYFLGGLAQQIAAGIALRVHVDEQCLLALMRSNRGQVDCDGRFADAALLIEYDTFHAASRRYD